MLNIEDYQDRFFDTLKNLGPSSMIVPLITEAAVLTGIYYELWYLVALDQTFFIENMAIHVQSVHKLQ